MVKVRNTCRVRVRKPKFQITSINFGLQNETLDFEKQFKIIDLKLCVRQEGAGDEFGIKDTASL